MSRCGLFGVVLVRPLDIGGGFKPLPKKKEHQPSAEECASCRLEHGKALKFYCNRLTEAKGWLAGRFDELFRFYDGDELGMKRSMEYTKFMELKKILEAK